MIASSVLDALERCARTRFWTVGLCGQFCAVMYGYDFSGYASAYVQWQQTPSSLKHPGTNAAPAGALYFWSGGPSGHGHVAVADGIGGCFSIDILGAGTVGRVPVTQISSQWGLPFLGWTYPYFQGKEWSPVMIYGVDVAAYQSDTVPDTTPGDAKPVMFAFTKATQGTSYINPRMAAQASDARAGGKIVGFYHFLEKGNIQAQAEYFVAHASLQAGDILACDWETNPATNTYASSAEKDQFIRAVQTLRPGHRVLLYCNTSFWKSIDTSSFAGDGLWIATAGYAAGKPPIQSAWVLHQYSTSGNIDHDVAQFSSQDAMRAWAGEGTGDVALTQADIDAVALATANKLIAGGGVLENSDIQRIFTTDGFLESPADASDHATNPFWAFETYVKDTGAKVRSTAVTVDAILAQAEVNGSSLTEIKTKLDAVAAVLADLDLSQIPAEVAAKIEALKLVVTVTEGP